MGRITVDIAITKGDGEEWIADLQTAEAYGYITQFIPEERVTDAERVVLTRDEALAIRKRSPKFGITCQCDARLIYGGAS